MDEDKVKFFEESSGGEISRRRFLSNVTVAAASASLLTQENKAAEQAPPNKPSGRKIRLGWIGCGGRGAWLAKLFRDHGGFEIDALADYFTDLVNKCGDTLGVEPSRRFTGLSGYKKLLESGVEALGVLDVPCFYPEQASAAVDAGYPSPSAAGRPRLRKRPEDLDLSSHRRLDS